MLSCLCSKFVQSGYLSRYDLKHVISKEKRAYTAYLCKNRKRHSMTGQSAALELPLAAERLRVKQSHVCQQLSCTCMYVCVCMHVCMSVCLHVCIIMCVSMYVCMNVCMYACMYVCMHVRMYVCTYVCIRIYVCNVCMYAYMSVTYVFMFFRELLCM